MEDQGTRSLWASRIVGQGEEPPDQLLANPLNWRIHPKHQQDALESVLDEVGWVQNVVVNQTTGHVIDGHLRISLAQRREEPMVPVVYVELSEDEERLMLAALDPLAAMAAVDEDKLSELLRSVEAKSDGVQALLRDIAEQHDISLGDMFDDLVGGDDDFAGTAISFEVVVSCPSPGDRDALVDLLEQNEYKATVRTVRE